MDNQKWIIRLRKIFLYSNISLIILFIIFLLYALFLLQDISFYMYGYDDFHIIYQALNTSFGDFLSYIVFKPLQLHQGFLQLASYQRALQGIFLKIIYMINGVEIPFYFHAFKAIFFAFNGMVVYLFTKKITKNTHVSIITGALYCSLPVIYDGLRHIGAAEPFSQFFLLFTIYLFVKFYDCKENFNWKQKYFYLVIIFLVGLCAIKARETGILLLPIIGGFLILKYKEFNTNKKWWVSVILLSLYLIPALLTHFSVVNDTEHEKIITTSEKIQLNINNLLIYNPETKTGNGEQTAVIFSLKQYLSETPGSLLGSLGFFIGWYVILMLLVYVYSKIKSKIRPKENNESIIKWNNYFIAVFLWFVLSVILMVAYVNPSDHSDIRYIGVMVLPTIIIVVSFCYFATLYIRKLRIKYISKYIMLFFLIILFLSVIINAGITGIYRRGGIGSRHLGMSMSTEVIFEDLYNQSFDNKFFFALTEISAEDDYIKCVLNTNIKFSDLIVTDDPYLSIVRPITEENIEESLAKSGVVYIITYREPINTDDYSGIELVEEISPCQKGYYCKLINFLKNQETIHNMFEQQFKMQPKYFVYKIQYNKFIQEEPVKIFCLGKEGVPENII